jgi:hypothetical protein
MNCFYRRQEILLCLPLAQRAKQLEIHTESKKMAFTIKGECIKQEYSIYSACGRGSKFDSISYFISMNNSPPLDIYFPPRNPLFLSGLYQKTQAGKILSPSSKVNPGARDKKSQTIEIQQTRNATSVKLSVAMSL